MLCMYDRSHICKIAWTNMDKEVKRLVYTQPALNPVLSTTLELSQMHW